VTASRTLPLLALLLGAAVALLGGAALWAYLRAAVLDRLGEPDQSLLFWYLPLLLFGGAALLVGIAGAAWGALGLRAARRQGR